MREDLAAVNVTRTYTLAGVEHRYLHLHAVLFVSEIRERQGVFLALHRLQRAFG
jgi:hypothetical protein